MGPGVFFCYFTLTVLVIFIIILLQLKMPDNGVLVHGMFMESCAWDMNAMTVIDSKAGEMSAELPMLHMEPEMDFVPDPSEYEAPLYKTSLRAGTLSTTGIVKFSYSV